MGRKSEVADALAKKQLLATETTTQGKKRKFPRCTVCLNCREEYDGTENDKEACEHHPGEVDLINDFFLNGEFFHQDHTTDDAIENHPDKFKWSCCCSHADDDSCEIGEHKEDVQHMLEMERRLSGSNDCPLPLHETG
ncbi:hypothetical protein IWX50DRAFT_21814 [Phyllosticta citricarpa]